MQARQLSTRNLISAGLMVVLATSAASATSYTVNWMQMAPTPFGSAPPYVSSYNLPGVGLVQMSYAAHPDFAEARVQNPALATGSVNYAGDTYSWTNNEVLGRTNWAYSGVLNTTWSVTYTFPSTVSAGQIILGTIGIGRRDPRQGENAADCISTIRVGQNGTHLGDWTGALNVGPMQFSPAVGSFSMRNSLTGPNGVDPWWNTGLSLVRINDAMNSLTVYVDHTAGDGLGVNIGVLTPEPSCLAMLGLGGVGLLRRRMLRNAR